MERIYFPMTCNVLVPGHIKCLRKLSSQGEVFVGLLTSEALKGYKKEVMSYEDREYILNNLDLSFIVIKQDSLDPTENLKKLKCTAIASGDGFEKIEEQAIKRLGLKKILVNSGSSLHSKDIYAISRTDC